MTSLPDIRCIKGLNDRFRLPRLGKIPARHPPGKGPTGAPPGRSAHFVVPDAVKRVYGAEPTALKILLPSEDLARSCPNAYKWYGASAGLKCKGDGGSRFAAGRGGARPPGTIADPHAPNDLVGIPCPARACRTGTAPSKAHFLFLLPEVSVSGVWQNRHPVSANVWSSPPSFRFLQRILGRVAMLPLTARGSPSGGSWRARQDQHLLK